MPWPKLLYCFENPRLTAQKWNNLAYLLAGKTMVGGLLGGTIAVEFVKRRTGDLFAIPMAVGVAIGRIGCFLSGIQDDTYGIPSAMASAAIPCNSTK